MIQVQSHAAPAILPDSDCFSLLFVFFSNDLHKGIDHKYASAITPAIWKCLHQVGSSHASISYKK